MMKAPGFESSQRALEALVHGVDPETGQKLPHDTVLNRVDILRVLLTAIAALETVRKRAQRRAQLPGSVGKSWDDDEERCLRVEYRQHKSIPDIAASHGRTVRAIEVRLELLGLLRPEDRTVRNDFLGRSHGTED
jgi:hypothetical protein